MVMNHIVGPLTPAGPKPGNVRTDADRLTHIKIRLERLQHEMGLVENKRRGQPEGKLADYVLRKVTAILNDTVLDEGGARS